MRCHSVACGYGEPSAVSNAIGYAMHYSRSHDAVIRVYNEAGNVIEAHEHVGVGRNLMIIVIAAMAASCKLEHVEGKRPKVEDR
jgi:hypothetical protein